MTTNPPPKMTGRPPAAPQVEQFIAAADYPVTKGTTPHKGRPWENPLVREDVVKSVNLRLPEPYLLKLQYLSQHTHKSQQQLIRDILCPAIDALLTQE